MRSLVITAVLATLLIVLVPRRALSQADTTLHVSQVMSPAELDATGVSTLSAEQRAALDAWLARYTSTVAQTVQRTASPPQEIVIRRPSVERAFRVARVIDDGGSVALDDGTVWAVNLPSRPTVDTWQVGDYVLVRRSAVAVNIGSTIFDYTLVNGRNARHSRVAVRLVGRTQ
ncbi:MAG TPA: hypothetical protein VF166_07480 [Gemmatimonadaceae bacterium]